MRALWVWIGANVGAQIVNLVESGLFLNTTPEDYCRILQNETYNEILMIAFVFLAMYSQFIVSLWYLGHLRHRILESIDLSQRVALEFSF